MTTAQDTLDDEKRDAPADELIRKSLSLVKPNCFFLYAGAGSGKTRSLKDALNGVLEQYGKTFRHRGRQVGVITYTNAARDEILRRVKHDPVFHVATIHSFAWSLIEGRTVDIRRWLASRLPAEIAEIENQQAKGRAGKASNERARKIDSNLARLQDLVSINVFTYNPNGDNFGRDALSHEEVISISSEFLKTKPTLQKIVLSRYPFLLIDESQDTLRPFMEALLDFEETFQGRFALGLFGDTMQRIYSHGKVDLANAVPERWERPAKAMNHRSRERIIRLANAIRSDADGWEQRARADRSGGSAFIYILPTATPDKPSVEARIRGDIAIRTKDELWNDPSAVKTLTLEHHMAATRLGFEKVFNALDPVPNYKTGFRDGTLAPLRLFTERVLPLVEANRAGDAYGQMTLLREHSPLLSKATLRIGETGAAAQMNAVRDATSSLFELFVDDVDPTCGDVLSVITETRLFAIPNILTSYANQESLVPSGTSSEGNDQHSAAWRAFFEAPFSEIPIYREYISDCSPYGTHQGVKGLEFPRVMVIADDSAMRFKAAASYEKLLGDKPPSDTDKKNIKEGKETSYDRTRRLLYVTCTRAEESLALVMYSDSPHSVSEKLQTKGWFAAEEIIMSFD